MTRDVDPELALARRAARSVAVRVSAATAVVLLAMSLAAFQLGRSESSERPEPTASPVSSMRAVSGEGDGWRDAAAMADVLALTLIGCAAAGAVGWVASGRAGRPMSAALALQRRFVADASHELRTPIAVLHARAQLLQRQTGPDDARRRTIDQLVADSRSLGDVVTDLLLAAELDAGAIAPVDLAAQDLFEQVARSFAVLADQARVTISVEPCDVVVRGARTPLVRALSCLVDNAVAHGRPGGHVVLSARLQPGPGSVQLVVADDGEGWPADRARLTERFTRGPVSATGTPRFGIGLALVTEIAAAHGGRLLLDDAPGGGAIATIDLPPTGASPSASRPPTTS